jgi:NAD(P)H dehydrogenase (quinone)
MTSILITYYSRTGNTRKMAEEILRGAQEAGGKVDIRSVDEVTLDSLPSYDALVFGTPDYYGGMASEIKALIDSSVKYQGQLVDKVGGAFSTSANIGGGNETAILSIIHALLIHGMIVPGVAIGDHYGPVGINTPDKRACTQAYKYGMRIASITQQLHS